MTEQTPITAAMPMSSPADYYDMSRVRPEVAVAMVKINELGQVFASRARLWMMRRHSQRRTTGTWPMPVS